MSLGNGHRSATRKSTTRSPCGSASRKTRLTNSNAICVSDSFLPWRVAPCPNHHHHPIADEVSDPDHARYGQHLQAHQVHALVAPTDEAVDAVHDWLAEYGIEPASLSYSPAKDWITVLLPVSTVEQMLDTQYAVYRHEDGTHLVRTPKWSLPAHLHAHIDTIQPTNSWMRARPQATALKVVSTLDDKPAMRFYTNASVADVCETTAVTPTCLRTLYETIDYEVQAAATNRMGLTDFLNETNNRNDTFQMLTTYRPEAAGAAWTFAFDSIANGTTAQAYTAEQEADGTGIEGNLDVQNMLSFAWPTPLLAYTTGGSPPYQPDAATTSNTNEPYLVWLEAVLGTADADLARVISTSYDDDEQTVPYAYAVRVCRDLAQLGARGVSLLYASGDSGVGPDGYCVANDGTNRSTFLPEFPSSCPYVTSVGATKGFNPEAAVTGSWASGGGFSSYFARPAYQDGVVPGYVASLDGRYDALYNSSGRAYPDVAAQGYADVVVWDNRYLTVGGTSAASPTLAALFALVNDALLAAGRRPLGFLNPWLYKRGYRAFTDITQGSAEGCSEISDGVGFPAQEGWDAVSGFGTPKFKSILQVLGLGNVTYYTAERSGWSVTAS